MLATKTQSECHNGQGNSVDEQKSEEVRFISSFGTLCVALRSQLIHVGITVIIITRSVFDCGT